jgi:hypothetical protein
MIALSILSIPWSSYCLLQLKDDRWLFNNIDCKPQPVGRSGDLLPTMAGQWL